MQNQITWKRSDLNGVYFSKCGKYAVKSDGNFGWYTYVNDGSSDWDMHSFGWDSSFKNAKKFAEYLNDKAVA
jgi:hypothetical protein